MDSVALFEHLHLGELRTGVTTSTVVKANWKILVENYQECLHCSWVHPELVDIVPVYKTNPGTAGSALAAPSFWFNGLQGSYLSGGRVPTDGQGNLVAMDGVIVGYNNSFGDPAASKVILLQYQPGDDGYSPIVRLHDYKTSAAAGSFIGVCPLGAATCPKNFVKLSDATPAAFNTLLIVASPQ